MRQQAACAGKMIIICNYGNSCALGQQLFCVGDILDGRARLVLQDQPFRICAMRDHVILHGCSLGARLIAALTAAQDGLTARIDVQHRDCRIAPCRQSRRRLSVRIDERTQHQIVIRLRRS